MQQPCKHQSCQQQRHASTSPSPKHHLGCQPSLSVPPEAVPFPSAAPPPAVQLVQSIRRVSRSLISRPKTDVGVKVTTILVMWEVHLGSVGFVKIAVGRIFSSRVSFFLSAAANLHVILYNFFKSIFGRRHAFPESRTPDEADIANYRV